MRATARIGVHGSPKVPSGVPSVVGKLDKSFGGDGIVTTDLGSQNDDAIAVAIQPDGKIVAVGNTDHGGKIVVAGFALPDNAVDFDFALARYDLDVAIDAQGRIVAAGTTGDQFALMRVSP